MLFTPDPAKQLREVIFSRKTNNGKHSCETHAYTEAPRPSATQQMAPKCIGLSRKWQPILPRGSLLIIYRLHDIILTMGMLYMTNRPTHCLQTKLNHWNITWH